MVKVQCRAQGLRTHTGCNLTQSLGHSCVPHTLTAPLLPLQGLRFEVVPSRFTEKLSKASFPTPYAYAMETAKQKALEVARRMHQARALLLQPEVLGLRGEVAGQGVRC